MTAASRSLATALRRARFASGLLRLSYTTNRDTTPQPAPPTVSPSMTVPTPVLSSSASAPFPKGRNRAIWR